MGGGLRPGEKGVRMSLWRAIRRLSAAAMLVVIPLITPASSSALGEVISVELRQIDGTPDAPSNTWSPDDTAGNDSGPNNGIVRTNDELRYEVEVRVEGGTATNTTISLALPVGVEASALPPFCLAGSSVTPALSEPVVPIDSTSWTALPAQRIVCNVGDRTPGSTLSYPFIARVRSEVPNGTALDPVVAAVISDDLSAPSVSDPVQATVSARPKYDLSKNAISPNENGGYLGGGNIGACPGDASKRCFNYLASVLIAAQDAGKGSAPLASPIIVTDDLSPDAIYGSPNGFPVSADPDFIAAGPDALERYGARLRSCSNTSVYTAPGIRVGGSLTTTNAVRDSGTISCTQPGGPGTPVTISIANADTSAYTVPSESYYPLGAALPADQGYVVAGRINFAIPVDAVRDLGVVGTDGRVDLRWDNTYTEFLATGIDGTPNDPTADLAFNNHRAVTASLVTRGSWNKAFYGVPNAVGNTTPADFRPGFQAWEGPTNTTSWRSGDGVILPSQRTISGLYITNRSTSGEPVTHLICDSWDNSTLVLAPGEYGPSTARMQQISSGGEAVWFSGYVAEGVWFDDSDVVPPLEIEYGTGPSGAGEACDDADSADGWVTDPTALPGGIASVSKVRIAAVLPASSTSLTLATVSIALEALPNPTGTIVPNWAAGKTESGSFTMAEMLADPSPWRLSTYNPSTHAGARGDRLTVGSAIARLNKEVFDDDAGAWVSTAPAITGGTELSYRLSPTLSAGVPTDVSLPMTIDDCLPESQTYVIGSASIAPTLIQFGAPADALLSCPSNQTFLRWDLGPQQVGSVIAPIEFASYVSAGAASDVYTNNAVVEVGGDPSPVAQRTAAAQVQVIQPAGVAINKIALTPQLDVNPPGETTPGQLLWNITFRNLDLPGALSDVDVIDVLPSNGLAGSSFSGTLAFDHATVMSGTGIDIRYTAQLPADVSMDGNDPSNGATGFTVWCDLPVGGAVVSGAGVDADCPQSAEAVTALRILRPGVFAPNEAFEIEVGLIPTGNAEGDVYVNQVSGRVGGLSLIVGPVAAPETIIASSLGNRVWRDRNGDGRQDVGEPGVDGITVELWGIDTDGNSVASSTSPLRTVTSSDGSYRFDELPAGTYSVRFDDTALGPDEAWTVADAGADDFADSDGDPITGEVTGVVLSSNTDLVSVDQGIVPTSRISGFVFVDANNDAVRTGDLGIVGVAVNLSGTDNAGNAVSLTATTNPDGSYQFVDLWPGTYTVTQDRSSVPAPYLDGQDASPNGVVSDGRGVTDDAISSIVLTEANSIENNFGELNPSSIGGSVFSDENGDGTFAVDEPPIDGVTVELTGTDDLGNPVALATTTALDGTYVFEGLRSGTYAVTQTQPPSWIDGADEAGSAGGTVADDAVVAIGLNVGTNAVGYNFGEEALSPSISLEKLVNGEDADAAPGLLVSVAAPVTFEYRVANTGNLDLTELAVTDDILGVIECPSDTLSVGASMVCTIDDVSVEGPYVNIGSVSTQPIDLDGADFGDRIEATDAAHYFGGGAGVEIVKRVDGQDADTAPGPVLVVGETAVFTYEIRNTGSLDLIDLELTDDVLGAIDCPSRVEAGQTLTCRASAVVERDAYVNIGVVSAQPVFTDATGTEMQVGERVEAADPAHYFGEISDLSIIKRVNGSETSNASGILVDLGDRLVFTYEVANTGNVDLVDLVVLDDVLGPVACPVTELAAEATVTCTLATNATIGTVTNIGSATARHVDTDGVVLASVSGDDAATYTARNPDRGLAFTGGSTGRIILLGLSLLLSGVGLSIMTKRRQPTSAR